jgi:hypothetical protein
MMLTLKILMLSAQILYSPMEGQNQLHSTNSPLFLPSPMVQSYYMETGFPEISKNIIVELPAESEIEMILLNSNSESLKVLDKGNKNAGKYCYTIDLRELSTGTYYYKLVVNNHEIVKSFEKK